MGQLTQYFGRKVNHYITKINKAYKKTHPYIYTHITRQEYPQTGTVLVQSANHRTLKNTNNYGNSQMLVDISIHSTERNLPVTESQRTEFFSVADRVPLTHVHKFRSSRL
jgi:hypothetical protein